MLYKNIVSGTFLSRPNRFIAHVSINGQLKVCHVKNTGRCRELLVPGASVFLEHHTDSMEKGRKTEYSLIGVYKNNMLINMDSQAPNQAAFEWLQSGGLFPLREISGLRREVVYKNSRFDIFFGHNGTPAFMEVKGVTLEKNGVALFPDAPTERGIRHLEELSKAVSEGYEGYLLFVIQMKGISSFSPNAETHPEFCKALKCAEDNGVHILAYDCLVSPDSMVIDQKVKVNKPFSIPGIS